MLNTQTAKLRLHQELGSSKNTVQHPRGCGVLVEVVVVLNSALNPYLIQLPTPPAGLRLAGSYSNAQLVHMGVLDTHI